VQPSRRPSASGTIRSRRGLGAPSRWRPSPFWPRSLRMARPFPFKGAETLLEGRVLFTGFHGDRVWGRKTQDLGPDIVRSDGSGTDLTEYRLWVGFVNCAVPFLGVRQIKDIHDISTSSDLAPWDVKGGYSRPICRRIVEERGVPRDAFGVEKKATAQFILGADDFLTRDMRLDYYGWLRSRRQAWVDRGVRPPSHLTDLRFVARARVGVLAERLRSSAAKRLGPRADALLVRLSPKSDPRKRHVFHQYAFHWAVDRAKERYPDPRRLLDASASSDADSQPTGTSHRIQLRDLARKSLRHPATWTRWPSGCRAWSGRSM